MLRFEVRDSGIGIPSDRLHTLFKPFSQVNASTTRRFGGTGLGLSIVKRLAEMMGGEAGVVSHDGIGSTFWFSARLGLDTATTACGEPMRSNLRLLKGRRVLAVDDHDTNRRIIKSQLEQYDVDIVCAASADDAWRELMAASEAGRPFEVALIDRHLPGCDGLEFGRRIRLNPTLNVTRLILLTASGHRDEPLFAGCGFAGCLAKPVSQRDLTEGLHAMLFGGAVAAPVPEPPSSPPAGAGYWILLAEDNVVNEKVACRTLEKLGHRVEVARNGREAVDAWATGRFDLILMDCQMPVMDGYEAVREIRRREADGRRIPIVALTAHAMKDDDVKCKVAGMDDYITKPLDREHLRRCLRRFLEEEAVPMPAQRGGTRSA